MRAAVLFAACTFAFAQATDPAYETLSRAYESLRSRDYDGAISFFLKSIEASPQRADIRKDLAYTYLKAGENELARDQFREAMALDPADLPVALEYAFLCYETKQQAQARRIFDRVRKAGGSAAATAEKAFHNIDDPLAEGIERWRIAIADGAENFSAHYELATLAEQRDELGLAAEHYQKAWRLVPDRRGVLVDLGRVLLALKRGDEGRAALLAASRGGGPRAAETARELLPERYPYVPEFRRALELDPANAELRRDLAYLLLRMDRQAEAERELRILAEAPQPDRLATTQLAMLLHGRGEQAAAKPLFDRVLSHSDDELTNRIRAVLGLRQSPQRVLPSAETSLDAKVMAERSIQAGYLKDAAQYLEAAHRSDPEDFAVMLRLGWTYNVLHDDVRAVEWFGEARRSSDPRIAMQADRAYRNLRPSTDRYVMSGWFFPVYSTRWHDFFSYAQLKTEIRTGTPIRPYISTRFVGDTRLTIGVAEPQYLSESSVIIGVGVRTVPWHGLVAWAEAGSAIGYLKAHMLPDYRGGISFARRVGRKWFADTTIDALFMSRFGDDFLVYTQSRAGYSFGPDSFRTQVYWSGNVTADSKRQAWANFGETGPGVRFNLPQSMYLTFNLLRGAYLIREAGPRRPNFHDFRVGFWYAFSY